MWGRVPDSPAFVRQSRPRKAHGPVIKVQLHTFACEARAMLPRPGARQMISVPNYQLSSRPSRLCFRQVAGHFDHSGEKLWTRVREYDTHRARSLELESLGSLLLL